MDAAGDAGKGGSTPSSGGSAGKSSGSGGSSSGTTGSGAESGDGSGGADDTPGGRSGQGGRGGSSGASGASDAGTDDGGANGGEESGGTSGVGAGGIAAGGAGGSSAGGGTTGAGAGTGGVVEEPCPETFTVSNVGYVRMPSKSGTCWRGPATSSGDATSSWSPHSFELCGNGCVLSITGTVNAATEENGYAGLVGLHFGLSQPLGSTTRASVVPTGTGVTLTYAATGAKNVRIELVSSTLSYCYGLPTETGAEGSTLNVPYSAFARRCWDQTLAEPYLKEAIQEVALTAPGGLEPHDYVLKILKLEEY